MRQPPRRLIALNKPFGVMSQFSPHATRDTLASFVGEPDVYPAGRLDADSEGLLLLTDDGALQRRISHPGARLWKRYWVQVEGSPGAAELRALERGVVVKGRMTAPARVRALAVPRTIWPRTPPIRVRQSIPDAWLEIAITEGRNRQVRRMTAAVDLPTLRLVRVAIGALSVFDRRGRVALAPGRWRWTDPARLFG